MQYKNPLNRENRAKFKGYLAGALGTAGVLGVVACGGGDKEASPTYAIPTNTPIAAATEIVEPTVTMEPVITPYPIDDPPLTPEQEIYMKVIEDRYEIIKDFFEGAGLKISDSIREHVSFEGDSYIIGFEGGHVAEILDNANYHDATSHIIGHVVMGGAGKSEYIIAGIQQPFAEMIPNYLGELMLAIENDGIDPENFKLSESSGINGQRSVNQYRTLKNNNKRNKETNWYDIHTPGWVTIAGLEIDYELDYKKMQEFVFEIGNAFNGSNMTNDDILNVAKDVFGPEVQELFDLMEHERSLYGK